MAGFQVDMSPLINSSMNTGRVLSNIGQIAGNAIQQSGQQGVQAGINELVSRAMNKDPAAFQQLMAQSPPDAQNVAQYLQQQQVKTDRVSEEAKLKRLAANQKVVKKLNLLQKEPDLEKRFNEYTMLVANPDDDFHAEDIQYLDDPENLRQLSVEYFGEDNANAMFGGVDAKKLEQGKGIMEGYSYDTSTGAFSIDPAIKARLDEVKASKANDKLDAKTRQGINKDVTQLTKDTTLIRNTAEDLDKLAKINSGPSSIAMVFKFMKALDPTSVVRESEFATAENSSGVPEKIRNTYNKLMNGEKLGAKQMQEFVTTAKHLANSAIKSSNVEVQSFVDTFEDTLTPAFKKSLLNRIHKPFNVQTVEVAPTPTESPEPAVNATQNAVNWEDM